LNKASEAQDKAEKAIKNANTDIDSAQADLHTISNETVAAEKSAAESSEALKNLKADLTAVELDYFQIGKDVNRSVAVADAAKRKAQAAQDNRVLLTSMYTQATNLLNERTGASEGTQTRAEQLKRKATSLLDKTLKHIEEIEQERKSFDSNEVKLQNYGDTLTRLHSLLDSYIGDIQQRLKYFETCELSPSG